MKKRCFEEVCDEKRRTDAKIIMLPKRATLYSAGYDIYSPVGITIAPGKPILIWTDVKVRMKKNEVFMVFVRSSMGKKMVVLANGTGIVDSDYYGNEDNDGNIGIMLVNHGSEPYVVHEGDRIAQGIFMKFKTIQGKEKATKKRAGGFGSTTERKPENEKNGMRKPAN